MRSDSLLADGLINGSITFTNVMKQPLFVSDLAISDLSLKRDTIGNVTLKASSSAGDRYNINATITGRGNDVSLTGSMAPQGNDVALNLDMAIRQLQLNTMEGALATAIYKASGTVNGNIKVDGTLAQPHIDGRLGFNDATFNTVLLGGDFRIDNETILMVSEKGFLFNNFTIRDSANNALNLNGIVSTPNFINYNFDLHVKADNFRALNTTKRQNKIFYGQLYLTSELNIKGTEEKPVVDGSVTINDKTNLTVVVPQQEPGVVEREGIVQFVNMQAPENDSLFRQYDSLNVSRLVGFDIATNIEVKKEAVLNIIVDEANGDFINVQGEALLTAGIDPSGKVNLTGSYELEKGAYEISFNFLRRKFEIQKGSKIVWLGEPTRATLDVSAVYVANTAPLDLVENQIGEATSAIRNTYLQKLPFQVWLKLGGELMKPEITFDIQLPTDRNYNVSKDIIQHVDTRLTQLRSEPGELNKQVFSLLLMNRFVGENPFQSSSGGGFSASSLARTSASKLLTEQLNQLASGLIQGVDITFDVASTDDYTTGERRSRTDLNMGLSKRLLNDRLTVTVGSNFELEGPQRSNQKSNNVAGDVSVNYQISKDGRYLLRAYRRNQYEGAIEGYVIEQGIGFVITMDYNHFSEILRRKKAKVEGVDDKKPGE
ncbi:MAG: translocation/assembly module TamB domain-containing protein [Chitinophagaceae bacterium]|nr:translocation/assembly module TamB domain-containing protein [Chitinophagaceae bacterium]